jgi:hypothetical protein
LQPLLENAGHKPDVRLSNLQVFGDRDRLFRAFLGLLESLLGNAAGEGDAINSVWLQENGENAVVRLAGLRCSDLEIGKSSICPELEIARRSFEALGGSVSLTEGPEGEWSCEVVLRSAPAADQCAATVGESIGKQPQNS